MSKLVPIQTYVPVFIADWIADEADAVKVSKSYWVSDIIYSFYKEHKMDEGQRKDIEDIKRHTIFLGVGLDALLASHDDETLRDKVHDSFRRRLLKMMGPGE